MAMNDSDLLHPPVPEPDITWRRFLLLVATAIVCFFLFMMGMMGGLVYFSARSWDCPQCERRPFDSVVWQTAPLEKPYPRAQMVDDLLKNYKLVGMTPEEVKLLLGPGKPGGSGSCGYFLTLGPERSMIAIDGMHLCLEFRDGVVANARVIEG